LGPLGDQHTMSEIKPSSDEAQAQRRERQLRAAMLPGMLLGFVSLLAGYFLYRMDVLSQNIGGAIGFVGGGLGLLLTFAGFRHASRHPVA
jgi:hypothetical protein